MENIEKIDLAHVDWQSSREFFESLRDELEKLEKHDEAYNFTWVGKRKSIVEAGAPINKTLRPDVKASKDFDNTENLLIVGDNLDALKILQESYLGQVKMIYIDPPYNTGHDFVYRDNFLAKKDDYEDNSIDENGDRTLAEEPFRENSRSNGRFHSDWLSMIYPRLKLARNLLSDDGAIFISIDDTEVHNLRKICDEIFDESNFLATFKWNRVAKAPSLSDDVRTKYEYVLCYQKKYTQKFFGKKSYNTQAPLLHLPNKPAKIIFPAGSVQIPTSFSAGHYSDKYQVDLLNDVIEQDGINSNEFEIQGCFAWSQSKINSYIESGNRFLVKKDFSTIYYYMDPEKSFISPSDVISDEECSVKRNTDANEDMHKMGIPFDYSKPVSLIKYLANMNTYNDTDALILDFFAGSGTTGQAIMDLNAEDGGRRKYILVQLSEPTNEKSEARQAGYGTIDQITAERLRRAGEKVQKDHPDARIDTGFRVFRIDSSNEKDNMRRTVNEYNQENIFDMVDNIKSDRTPLDLLFGAVYASALSFDLKLDIRRIGDNTVYLYGYFGESSGLVACFDDVISDETIKAIAKLKPLSAVFKDSSFADSAAKINLSEHFRILSVDTKVKVI